MPSEKTKELLDNLRQIRSPRKKQPVLIPVSNQYGEDEKGKPIYIDRIYGDIYGKITLSKTTYVSRNDLILKMQWLQTLKKS